MNERDGHQAGVPCWVQTVQPDPKAAVDFYTELFGWEAENLMPADHPGDYIVCRLRGRDVAAIVSPHGAPAPGTAIWTTHVWVDSADETAAKVGEAGGELIGEPFDSPGGGRQAVVSDSTGADFCLWEPRERKGAQLVNEPGAWAMSNLQTNDPDAAKRFYAAVFGWRTETFDMGVTEITMFKLPGYVGGRPEQPVARDVVATMMRAGEEQAYEPQWSVDFWIWDINAAAGKVKELGGTVIAEPYGIPDLGMKEGVFADPQGAAFTLTQPPGVAAS